MFYNGLMFRLKPILFLFSFFAAVAASVILFSDSSVYASSSVSDPVQRTSNVNETPCNFVVPEEQVFDAHLITVRRQLRVETGEVFQVKVFMKNTGNMPWFSNESGCPGPFMFLGTMRERDRNSDFYDSSLEGWRGGNRILMDQKRVDPGEIASFTFEAEAPDRNTLYKEYFAPVVEGTTWIDNAEFYFTSIIGHGGATPRDAFLKLEYANRSGSTDYINLKAEKWVLLKLSQQRVYLKLGDEVVRSFPVSSGKASTPTPVGTTTITLKQDVRIGHAHPHYIMPYFMWFRAGGYGFHALPSIGSANLRAQIRRLQAEGKEVPTSLYYGDALWREAREHIGIPVSHGCVRLFPEDAEWMYNFVELGTKVVVER